MSSSISKTSKLINNVFKSRNILLSQLKLRGYDTSEYENISLSDVYIMVKHDKMDMLLSSSNEKIYVKYSLDKILRASSVHNTIDELFEYKQILNKETDTILFITKTEPNDTILSVITQLWNEHKIYVNIINIRRLLFNVLEHEMVPKHRILSDVESKNVLQKYNIKNKMTQLPTISRYDPVAIAIGLRPGQVCEIIRPSPLTIKTLYYRICI